MCNEELLKQFNEQITDEDIEVQLSAVEKLPLIAAAVGEDDFREKVLPEVFSQLRFDVSDEVLLKLAEGFTDFIPLIGGYEHVEVLFPFFEKFLQLDDSLTRLQTIYSLKDIINEMPDIKVEELVFPLIVTLSEENWFSGKCSALGLISSCYVKCNSNIQEKLRYLYHSVMEDESPLVRSHSVINLTDFITVLNKETIIQEFLPIFRNLIYDDQDSIKQACVDVALNILRKLSENEIEEHIIPLLIALGHDVSWRVRFRFASEITNLERACGYNITKKFIIDLFQILAKDVEPQVRQEIAKNLVMFCKVLQEIYKDNDNNNTEDIEPSITTVFFNIIIDLDKDGNEVVEEELSNVLEAMPELLGQKYTKSFLLPLFFSKLENNSRNIKESTVSGINNLINIMGYAHVAETIRDIISQLEESIIWRARRKILVTLTLIADQIGYDEFNKYFLKVYQNLLQDSVAAVRRTATLLWPNFVMRFGNEWALESLTSSLCQYLWKPYNYKYVALFSIDEILHPTISSPDFELIFETAQNDTDNFVNISILSAILQEKLESQWVQKALLLFEDHQYFNDDIFIYAETIVYDLQGYSRKFPKDVQNKITYLETTITLILKVFLYIVECLAADKCINVRLRASSTLKNISNFSQIIYKNINASKSDPIKEIPEEKINEIKAQIEENFFWSEIRSNFLSEQKTNTESEKIIIVQNSSENEKEIDTTEAHTNFIDDLLTLDEIIPN